MCRLLLSAFVLIVMAPAVRAQERDPMQPRPPLTMSASRTERLEAFVRLYLQEFITAVQRADTVALGALVTADLIPDAEKPVAARAGCASLGAATMRLKESRIDESPHVALPLAGLRLGERTILLAGSADTVARVQVRIFERRRTRVPYAPLEVVFTERNGSWEATATRGMLAGLCGLAQEAP